PGAALVRGQSVHLQHGQPAHRQASDRRARRARQPGALHRPDAAGAGAHRHRHQLRHDGPVPRRAARLAGPERHRPRRRRRGNVTGASLHHLLIVPVVLPMLAAAVLTLLGGQRARLRSLVNVVATAAGLGVALEILAQVDAPDAASATGVYLASNWEAPFGIVLVGDRLSALMLVLVGVVSLGAAIYAIAGWGRAGVNFHPLFQI